MITGERGLGCEGFIDAGVSSGICGKRFSTLWPLQTSRARGSGVPSYILSPFVLQSCRQYERSYDFSDQDVIMCSFNQYYKITPDLWKLWMGIMRNVPTTKLWLIKFDAVDIPRNLKAETEAEGVDFSRIVISDMFPRELEFLIKGLADVFLDTPEFNAHTTATDALWAGVPIVSLPGLNMAQRVAGSLCKDAGMSYLLVSCESSEVCGICQGSSAF